MKKIKFFTFAIVMTVATLMTGCTNDSGLELTNNSVESMSHQQIFNGKSTVYASLIATPIKMSEDAQVVMKTLGNNLSSLSDDVIKKLGKEYYPKADSMAVFSNSKDEITLYTIYENRDYIEKYKTYAIKNFSYCKDEYGEIYQPGGYTKALARQKYLETEPARKEAQTNRRCVSLKDI